LTMSQELASPQVVSIVVNNYNYARFLTECIDSALHQTYSAVEVVVVDDGSTDESREVIRNFGDRIKTVFKNNGGQGSAINAGFAASTGSIVIFLDADDELCGNYVAQLAAAASGGPDVVVGRVARTTGAGAGVETGLAATAIAGAGAGLAGGGAADTLLALTGAAECATARGATRFAIETPACESLGSTNGGKSGKVLS